MLKNKKGLTLIEILVATAVFIVTITIIVSILTKTVSSDQRQFTKTILQNDARHAFEEIVRDGRLAKGTGSDIKIETCQSNFENFPAFINETSSSKISCAFTSSSPSEAPPLKFIGFVDIQSSGTGAMAIFKLFYAKTETDSNGTDNAVLYSKQFTLNDPIITDLEINRTGGTVINYPEQRLFSQNVTRLKIDSSCSSVSDGYVFSGTYNICFKAKSFEPNTASPKNQPGIELEITTTNIKNTESSPYSGEEEVVLRTVITSRGYFYQNDNISDYP